MALVKVYDPQNVEHEMESVDARECCNEMGWTLTPQEPSDPIEAVEPADAKAVPTRDEMKAFLTEKGIQFANNIKGSDLAAMYDVEKAKAE